MADRGSGVGYGFMLRQVACRTGGTSVCCYALLMGLLPQACLVVQMRWDALP
jgi:hypothetical protein